MNIPFLKSQDGDQEPGPPWGDLIARSLHENVATLRRIADEADEEHAEELRAVANDFEAIAETYESDS